MNDILNATITIASVEDKGTQIKIKDENAKTWTFFKMKKTGGMTAAYQQFQMYHQGETVGVGYKETPNPYGGVYRNIMNFQPANYGSQAPIASPKSEFNATVPSYEAPKARNYDREAYEKCCSIWAAALYGKGLGNSTPLGGNPGIVQIIREGEFWELFQVIRADGANRFEAKDVPEEFASSAFYEN